MRVTLVEDLPENMLRMVDDHLLDKALAAKINSSAALDFTSIWSEPLFLALRKGHALCSLSSTTPEDAPPFDFIRLTHCFGYELEGRLPKQDGSSRISKRFDLTTLRFETTCRHICHSDDCTIVSVLAAEQREPKLGRLGTCAGKGDCHYSQEGGIEVIRFLLLCQNLFGALASIRGAHLVSLMEGHAHESNRIAAKPCRAF
ncbi:hypothetical protein GS605_09365 [Ruegeria sp. HKCCD7559]|nr:hypothetical protein [Ruegeria sp. HKCCD7559]